MTENPESIYVRLFRYQSTTERSQLENFLTEAFADLMARRCDRRTQADFIAYVLFGEVASEITGGKHLARLKEDLKRVKNLTWGTQKRVNVVGASGQPDIIVSGDNKPLVVIENKVNAAIGVRGTDSEDEDDDESDKTKTIDGRLNQMNLYDDWLSGKNPNGGLVFLTHQTLPPQGFLEPGNRYSIPLRARCYWKTAIDWLAIRFHDKSDSLVHEFVKFLGDKVMKEDMNKSDLAALGNLLRAVRELPAAKAFDDAEVAEKLESLMHEARRVMRETLPKGWRPKECTSMWHGGGGRVIWDFQYYDGHPWYCGWGFCVGGKPGGFSNVPLPEGDVRAFVQVASDESEAPLILPSKLRPLWTAHGEQPIVDLLCTKETGALGHGKKSFGDDFLDWLTRTGKEAAEILQASAGAARLP
jgi:hypothetical protein